MPTEYGQNDDIVSSSKSEKFKKNIDPKSKIGQLLVRDIFNYLIQYGHQTCNPELKNGSIELLNIITGKSRDSIPKFGNFRQVKEIDPDSSLDKLHTEDILHYLIQLGDDNCNQELKFGAINLLNRLTGKMEHSTPRYGSKRSDYNYRGRGYFQRGRGGRGRGPPRNFQQGTGMRNQNQQGISRNQHQLNIPRNQQDNQRIPRQHGIRNQQELLYDDSD